MKILWFSNTPALGEEYISNKISSGGWLSALDKAVQQKVELHIVFYHVHMSEPFSYGNTHYYPIKRHAFYVNLLKGIIFNEIIDKQDIEIYFDIIRKVNPDLIHIHGTENPFGCVINKVSIPTLISVQGLVSIIFHKYCVGIDKKFLKTLNNRISRLSNGIRPFYRDYKYHSVRALTERRNLKDCRYIMGRTDWDKQISHLLSPSRVYFHEDRILRDIFYQYHWKPDSRDNFIIHTTASGKFYKGLETVCEATSILTRYNFNFVWRIAGIDKSDLIIRVVKRHLGKNYPKTNLFFMGNVNERELVNLMLESDLFVMPSHIENNSNSLCEAMMLGMPCISTAVGGVGSLISDRIDGFLVQDGDPWAMAGAILQIQQEYFKAIDYGQKARERALIRHNPDRIVDDMIMNYQNIIDDYKTNNNNS